MNEAFREGSWQSLGDDLGPVVKMISHHGDRVVVLVPALSKGMYHSASCTVQITLAFWTNKQLWRLLHRIMLAGASWRACEALVTIMINIIHDHQGHGYHRHHHHNDDHDHHHRHHHHHSHHHRDHHHHHHHHYNHCHHQQHHRHQHHHHHHECVYLWTQG